jgi:hypothetical protein
VKNGTTFDVHILRKCERKQDGDTSCAYHPCRA